MLSSGQDPAASPLAIHLFGSFDLRADGDPLPRLRFRKTQWLLALLTLRHGASVEREWLAGLLWPEQLGHQGLRNSLTDLRRILGPQAYRLRSPSSHTLALELGDADVDLVAFDRAIAQGDPPALARAVALYRGPLLEGCVEEWVVPERQAREQAYLQALERLAAHALAAEEWGAAECYLRQVVAVDPLRESAQRALMQSLAAGGNTAAVLLVYRELRLVLHRELNAEPDAETQALFQQLRAQAREKAARGAGGPEPGGGSRPPAAGSAAVPAALSGPGLPGRSPPLRSLDTLAHDLPLQLTRFLGREAEVEQLLRLLGDPLNRLVTLTGPGGAGKTRLGIQVADQVAPAFEGRVYFVELAALPDPNLIPFALAVALKLSPEPGADLLQRVVDRLGGAPSLVLFDNFEHLLRSPDHGTKSDHPPAAGGTGLVRVLLERVPRLHCLVTSRQPLHLGGEREFPVPPLAVPAPTDTPQRLLGYGSVALYADRARLARPDFAVTELNAAAVAALCRKLEGMPLAIEMAAAWARTLPPARMLERLERHLDLLVTRRWDLPPRQQSLRATFEWSYELLSPELQESFARLSVFRGGWTLEGAEAVCGTDALLLLAQLEEQSLILVQERGEATRYRMLEPLREYAVQKLAEREEGKESHERHASFYVALAEEARSKLYGPELGLWLERLAVELDNVRAALKWCQSDDNSEELSLRLVAALQRFWEERGHQREGRAWLEAAITRGSGRTAARARALAGAAKMALHDGDRAVAQARFEESLAIIREVGDRRGIAGLLIALAILAGDLEDDRTARALNEESLALMRERGDLVGISQNLFNLGYLAQRQGNEEEARRLWEECRAIDLALGIRAGYVLWALGQLAKDRGDYAEAHRLWGQGLRERQEVCSEYGIAAGLENFASLAAAEGQPERAVRLWAAGAALREALGAAPACSEQALAALRSALGEQAFAAAFAEGHRLERDQAIEAALAP